MMISPEDDYFAGVSRSGFFVFQQTLDRFDLVDVRRITPPKQVLVRNRHWIKDDQHSVVFPVGVTRSTVQRGSLLNEHVERRIGEGPPPAHVFLACSPPPLDRP